MTKNKEGDTFWLDGWNGKGKGGVYTRCNLNQCIKKMNEMNAHIVGIKLDMDNGWNLELIMEEEATCQKP